MSVCLLSVDIWFSKKKVAELLSGQILAQTGAPTIAPLSDKRPVYDRSEETLKDLNS